METQFVPYDLAVKLKELGFDEECFRGYSSDGEIADYTCSFKNYNDSLFINAPLWQQAFDWFRIKKFENSIYWSEIYKDYRFSIINRNIYIKEGELVSMESKTYYNFDIAKEDCLKELIKIYERKIKI